MLTWAWLAMLLALPAPRPPLIVGRAVVQDGGSWVVDYRLSVPVPGDLRVHSEGWVSQSRSPSGPGLNPHAVPLFSYVAAGVGRDGGCVLVPDVCRETLSVSSHGSDSVRLRFEHAHDVTGRHDPLLGVRRVTIRLGDLEAVDVLPLDVERPEPLRDTGWPSPPQDRLDATVYRTAPDSLHLEAHVSGNSYYRFPERQVRYGTRMRLTFYYLVAAGTEGSCAARVCQYKDTESAWKALSAGNQEIPLAKVGRWTRVDRVFTTEADATTLAVDVRIESPSEVGEAWIDSISLSEVGREPEHGP